MQHEGAEKSAHETITAEHETWSNIGHLADQYETIAQQAQAEYVATILDASALGPEQVEEVIASDAFGSLIAELRRGQANGADPTNLIGRAVVAGGLGSKADLASTLRNRVSRFATATSGGTHRPRRPRYIAGLIPEATGPMPADMTQALTELKELIEQRAAVLAGAAVTDGEAWLRDLRPRPTRTADRAAWERELATVVAYRDRYRITTSTSLGPATGTQLQRADRQRAEAAIRRAQRYAVSPSITVPIVTRAPGSRDGLER